MADLTFKETIELGKKDPEFGANLAKDIAAGLFDDAARAEGVDISNLSPTFKQEEGNLGTGFTPKKEFTGEENLPQAVGKALQNAPRSGGQFVKNIVEAVTKPKQTIQTLATMVRGVGAKAGEKFIEETDLGQRFAEKANEFRLQQGLPPLEVIDGKLQAESNEDLEMINGVIDFFKERYGGEEQIKETVVEDPIGVLADLAGVLTGAGAGVRATGLTRTGAAITRAGQALEPVSTASKITSTIGKSLPSGQTVRTVARDVIPTSKNIAQKEIVGGLDLSQGQVKNFTQITGQTPGDYLLTKTVRLADGSEVKLLGETPEATLQNVSTLKGNSYSGLREQLAGVTDTYKAAEVPRFKQTLEMISKQLTDADGNPTVGLESQLDEVRSLMAKDDVTLSDVQRAKEIIDERWSIYNRNGTDVRAGDTAAGLDNVRSEIRKFIEDEGAKNDIDVRGLNEDVSFSYKLEKAIDDASTRDLTRNQFGLTDHIIGTGLGIGVLGGGIDLSTAVGIFVAKRVIESPAFKFSLARGVSALSDSQAAKLLKQLQENTLTPENKAILQDIITNAQDNAVLLNPTLDVVTETANDASQQ